MSKFLVIIVGVFLVSSAVWAQKPLQFFIMQKESYRGLEQISLALNPDGNWVFTSNSNALIATNKQPYGLFSVKIEKALADQFKKISRQSKKEPKTDSNSKEQIQTFKHSPQFFVDGTKVVDAKTQTQLYDLFSQVLVANSLKPLDGGFVELVKDQIQFERYKNGKVISKSTKKTTDFCLKFAHGVCEFELGYIEVGPR